MVKVLCNVGRAAAQWRTDHHNYDPVALFEDWAYYTPIRFA